MGSDGKLGVAVLINVLLTVAQIVGGLLSGSMSLLADALHNLSDAGAIVVAIVARRIGNRDADPTMTYGYKRAEIIGTLINSSALILVGVYLIFESAGKFLNPAPVDGWIMFWVAGIAFVIDAATAALTYSAGAKDNLNIRAAFIHNVSDALSSIAVIAAGVAILMYEVYFVDLIAAIGISAYVIYHGLRLLKRSVTILMQATPPHIRIDEVRASLEAISGVTQASHIHVWQLDDQRTLFEGHFTVETESVERTKREIRQVLNEQFGISHSTLEID